MYRKMKNTCPECYKIFAESIIKEIKESMKREDERLSKAERKNDIEEQDKSSSYRSGLSEAKHIIQNKLKEQIK